MKNNSKMIGTICLWNFSENYKLAEVGYDLNPEFQKKGIMSEALNSVINFGFNKLGVDRIEAFTHVQNENSKKLLEKNGFNFVKDRKDIDNLSNIVFKIEKPTGSNDNS